MSQLCCIGSGNKLQRQKGPWSLGRCTGKEDSSGRALWRGRGRWKERG